MVISIYNLRLFCTLVEKRSFSNTAKEYWITQPTVSSHLATIEKSLGVKLIYWDPKKHEVKITESGKIFYQAAKSIILTFNDVENLLGQKNTLDKSENIILGSTFTPSNYILPSLIGEFSNKYPEPRIVMHVIDSENVMNSLKDESLDAGIYTYSSILEKIDPNIKIVKCFKEEVAVIISAHHPLAKRTGVENPIISKKDFEALPLIMSPKTTPAGHSIINQLTEQGLKPKVVLEISNPETAKQYLEGFDGGGLFTVVSIKKDINSKFLRTLYIDGVKLTLKFVLAFNEKKKLSPLSKKFISFLGSNLTNNWTQ